MVTRGRPNVNKAPAKAASKKATATPKTAKQKAGKDNAFIEKAKTVGKKIVGAKTKKGTGSTGGKHKSARQRLRHAYEKRANRQIRFGQLGQARRTLRRKATVI